jgi:uncharacterized protein YbaR (Trm112 family)
MLPFALVNVEGVCACPSCKGRLERRIESTARSLSCHTCGRSYPIVEGIPVLVEGAKVRLAEAALDLARTEGTVSAALARLGHHDGTTESSTEHLLLRNLAFWHEETAHLRSHLTVADVIAGAKVAEATGAYGALALIKALHKDWSGDPTAESVNRTIERAVSHQIEAYGDRAGVCAVLGAGTGRYLYDVARHFDRVVGVELSFPFVRAFHRLAAQSIPLGWIDGDVRAEFVARRPSDRDSRILYVVGDALSMPLAPASVATVISIFFADVVPLAPLLAELRRVLVPGGRFINYGPMHYHFEDPAHVLGREEAERAITASGFVFEEQSWSKLSGTSAAYDAWSFVATKTDRAP